MPWLTDVKGENKGIGIVSNYEISVLHSDNTHGIKSWGWMGKDKLLIANSGACRDGVHPYVWAKYLEMAEDLRNLMNNSEV